MNRSFATLLAVVAACSLAAHAWSADEKSAPVRWKGAAADGAAIAIPPATARPTVLLFVMPSQPRTHDVIEMLTPVTRAVGAADDVQVLLVVSGEKAADGSARLRSEESCNWPIVIDRDYALSGLCGVHAWPTTVLIGGGGDISAHVAGLPKHYAKNMETHLAFACGKIDQGEFERRIAAPELIVDDPKQMASRHLQVAQRLLDKGLVEPARIEVEKCLRLNPDDPALRVSMVRSLLALGDINRAAQILDGIDAAAVSPLEVNLLRGRVLAGQGKDAEAILVLQKATRLNPNPAEAWYELGLAFERQKDFSRAAEAFRRAFETTETGRRVRPAPK